MHRPRSVATLRLCAGSASCLSCSRSSFARSCPPTARAGAVHADRDRDKIFDDLEPQLTEPAPRPVLVSLREPASAARLGAIERRGGRSRRRSPGCGSSTRSRPRATPAQIRALAARARRGARRGGRRSSCRSASPRRRPSASRAPARTCPGLTATGLVAAVIDSGHRHRRCPTCRAAKVIGVQGPRQRARPTPYDDHGHGSLVSEHPRRQRRERRRGPRRRARRPRSSA